MVDHNENNISFQNVGSAIAAIPEIYLQPFQTPCITHSVQSLYPAPNTSTSQNTNPASVTVVKPGPVNTTMTSRSSVFSSCLWFRYDTQRDGCLTPANLHNYNW